MTYEEVVAIQTEALYSDQVVVRNRVGHPVEFLYAAKPRCFKAHEERKMPRFLAEFGIEQTAIDRDPSGAILKSMLCIVGEGDQSYLSDADLVKRTPEGFVVIESNRVVDGQAHEQAEEAKANKAQIEALKAQVALLVQMQLNKEGDIEGGGNEFRKRGRPRITTEQE